MSFKTVTGISQQYNMDTYNNVYESIYMKKYYLVK